jgi:hypothetical protein
MALKEFKKAHLLVMAFYAIVSSSALRVYASPTPASDLDLVARGCLEIQCTVAVDNVVKVDGCTTGVSIPAGITFVHTGNTYNLGGDEIENIGPAQSGGYGGSVELVMDNNVFDAGGDLNIHVDNLIGSGCAAKFSVSGHTFSAKNNIDIWVGSPEA